MREFIGYHGTTKKNGMSILKTKQFQSSGTYRDWLGRGVYFFEDDKHQAYMFAKYKGWKTCKHEDICVLEAFIRTEQDRVLNLSIHDTYDFFETYRKGLETIIDRMKAEAGDWEHKEGFIVDYLCDVWCDKIDVVKAVYSCKDTMNFGKMLKKLEGPTQKYSMMVVQTQLCVKKTDCIDKALIKEVNCDDYRGNEEKSIG